MKGWVYGLGLLTLSGCTYFEDRPIHPSVQLTAFESRPLAVAVMGALTTSVLLSLIATPVFYHLLVSRKQKASA
jgi:multidrug efflux pump subunit AcrB